MSFLRTEDQDSQRQGEDLHYVSEMQDGIPEKELILTTLPPGTGMQAGNLIEKKSRQRCLDIFM